MASLEKIQRNESANLSIFFPYIFHLIYWKSHFYQSDYISLKVPISSSLRNDWYVQCPCSLKGVFLLESVRKFCAEERTDLTCHSLVTCIKKIHFSPLSGISPLRLKRNQGIGSKIGCVLEAAPGLSLEYSQIASASNILSQH